MPDELAAYMDEIGLSARHSDHRQAIGERLNSIKDLFRFGRYRPKPSGSYRIPEDHDNAGGSAGLDTQREKEGKSGGSGGQGGRKGDVYALFTDEGGVPAERIDKSIEPEVTWVTAEDGSRADGDLEDRAARYLADQNMLLINGDFRAFTDMTERWEKLYDYVSGAKTTIKDVVREWFEQQLIETVMSAHALAGCRRWSEQEVAELWTESALTAAVLPRYHINEHQEDVGSATRKAARRRLRPIASPHPPGAARRIYRVVL